MRLFLDRFIMELSLRKVARITWISESTLTKYIRGGSLRSDTLKKIRSNIEIWVCDLTDERVDVCAEKF